MKLYLVILTHIRLNHGGTTFNDTAHKTDSSLVIAEQRVVM
jgi:hypothetical protein